jgi:hypothetical protein
MGKIRQRAVLLQCRECDAQEDMPCIHKTTGRALKNFHKSRMWGAKQDVLNKEVAHIEGGDEGFWEYVDRLLGLDPTDQYHGEW